jgi:hypothetical protein
MNNKFGRDDRYRHDPYRGESYRRDREAREPFWRGIDEDRGLRSPDQEFETSGPYRQPREPYGQVWSGREGWRDSEQQERGRFDGLYAPSSFAWSADNGRYNQYDRNAASGRGGYAGRGPKGYTRTDDRIREDVCERLSWNDEVDATDISVRVADGEVTLEGSVETRHMKRLAEDLAEDVLGVTDVHNTIRVKKPILTELKEKITGEAQHEHYANTGTRTTRTFDGPGPRNGTP